MKELTIEEKAKAYDEAIAKGRQIQNTPYTAHWDIMKEVVEHLLPELKESEDERMMNDLHSWMKEFGGAEEYTEKVYQWIKGLLEKQGEKNPAWSEEDEKMVESCLLFVNANRIHPLATKCIDWLKSIKDKAHWKPSEEMLEALYRVIPDNVMGKSENEMLLDKLYQGLKYGRVLSK